MERHSLETFLTMGSLCPSDTDVGAAVTGSDWWSGLKTHFDDLIWLYYPYRTVFLNERFPIDAPVTARANIIKSFAIYIRTQARQFDRLWVGYMSDFNPLWNVDGVEGFVSKDTHTGTDVNAHSGHDKTSYEDNGNTKRSGNETSADTGSDTTTDSNTTYDSSTFFDGDKSVLQHGKTNTHTYNNVTDTKDLDGFSDVVYNSQTQETRNLTDEHVDLKVRQGNIGVTQSDKILGDAQRLYQDDDLMNFYKYVVRACVNQVSYAVD